MKHAAFLALSAVAVLLLGGCLESQEVVTVLPDGRGRLTQVWTLDRAGRDALVRRAAELLTGRAAPADLPPAAPLAPVWVRLAAHGVEGYELERVEVSEREGKDRLEVEASFDDLSAAARAGSFFTCAVRLEKANDHAWRLTCYDVWAPIARDPKGEIGGRPYGEVVDALADRLGGLALDRRFVLPSKVVSTSGEVLPDGRSVRWRITAADLKKPDALRLTIVFEDRPDLELAPFRRRPDPEALVNRLLEPPPDAAARR